MAGAAAFALSLPALLWGGLVLAGGHGAGAVTTLGVPAAVGPGGDADASVLVHGVLEPRRRPIRTTGGGADMAVDRHLHLHLPPRQRGRHHRLRQRQAIPQGVAPASSWWTMTTPHRAGDLVQAAGRHRAAGDRTISMRRDGTSRWRGMRRWRRPDARFLAFSTMTKWPRPGGSRRSGRATGRGGRGGAGSCRSGLSRHGARTGCGRGASTPRGPFTRPWARSGPAIPATS
jgi:hypothetical protein